MHHACSWSCRLSRKSTFPLHCIKPCLARPHGTCAVLVPSACPAPALTLPTPRCCHCVAGLPPSMRCPVCKAAVHESAFHHIEKRTTFVVGETVLKWDMATAALQKQQNPSLARVEVRRSRMTMCAGY